MSNPPYIPSKDISGLQAEVGRHEPRVALDGGIDGLDALLNLCDGAAFLLKPGGFFAFEVCIFSPFTCHLGMNFLFSKVLSYIFYYNLNNNKTLLCFYTSISFYKD